METTNNAHAHKIDFKEAFNYGWEVVKEHWGFLLLVGFLTFIVTWPFGIFDNLWTDSWLTFGEPGSTMWEVIGLVPKQEILWYLVYKVLYFVLTFTLAYNTQKLYLQIVHGHEVATRDLFRLPTLNTLKYFVAMFIYVVLVLTGLVLFILPGIYFYFKYFYVSLLVLDKDLSIDQAAKKSAKIMQGNKWKMAEFLLMIAVSFVAILIVGLICLIVGVIPAIFIAIWICTFANLHVYKKLAN